MLYYYAADGVKNLLHCALEKLMLHLVSPTNFRDILIAHVACFATRGE